MILVIIINVVGLGIIRRIALKIKMIYKMENCSKIIIHPLAKVMRTMKCCLSYNRC